MTYIMTKPKVRTVTLPRETRDQILSRFPKVVDFARECGIDTKISRDNLYRIFRGELGTQAEISLITGAWTFLNAKDFDRKTAEAILKNAVEFVEMKTKTKLTKADIITNLAKFNNEKPF